MYNNNPCNHHHISGFIHVLLWGFPCLQVSPTLTSSSGLWGSCWEKPGVSVTLCGFNQQNLGTLEKNQTPHTYGIKKEPNSWVLWQESCGITMKTAISTKISGFSPDHGQTYGSPWSLSSFAKMSGSSGINQMIAWSQGSFFPSTELGWPGTTSVLLPPCGHPKLSSKTWSGLVSIWAPGTLWFLADNWYLGIGFEDFHEISSWSSNGQQS
jgi:hypothetical protein